MYEAIFSMGASKAEMKQELRPPPSVRLIVSDRVGLGWKPDDAAAGQTAMGDDVLGARLAPRGAVSGSTREVVMGLDFGTSSTKVVLADRALNSAYAVPFMESVGVGSYLLPSGLVETDDGRYILSGKGPRHADLKLAMLADLADEASCARVCAFLALVIRRARAWLYEAKREQYVRTDILWTLALGQPADQVASARYRGHFEHLGKVAWSLAGKRGAVGVNAAQKAWRQREKLVIGDELEVRPMAELSAQVHGFVSSSHFDVRQPNIYLIVDVGAGTVDASLFRVQKDRGGTVSFSFFTHSVELFGAANLNRFRLDWWLEQLRASGQALAMSEEQKSSRMFALVNDLERLRLPTEYRGHYPELYSSYVEGVEVTLQDGALSPDDEFHEKVRNQVAGRVLYGAWKEQLLTQDAVKDMPFFLCGGGARHPFYARLKTRLRETPNCTWLSAMSRELALPTNIIAPGVTNRDYDRLSVAYGLSQLNPGVFERVTAIRPVVAAQTYTDWTTFAVDKSVC